MYNVVSSLRVFSNGFGRVDNSNTHYQQFSRIVSNLINMSLDYTKKPDDGGFAV